VGGGDDGRFWGWIEAQGLYSSWDGAGSGDWGRLTAGWMVESGGVDCRQGAGHKETGVVLVRDEVAVGWDPRRLGRGRRLD